MKKTLLVLAALVAPAIAVAQEGPKPITMSEALEMAKKNQPTMIAARGTLRTNAAALRAAKWAFLPQLSLSYGSSTAGGGNYVNGELVKQADAGWSFSRSLAGLSVTLWDGGTKLGAVRSGNANMDVAEAAEVAAEFNVAQQVKAQYYAILQARETEANALEVLKQNEFLMTISQAKVRNGTATVSDTLTATTGIATARISILSAQNQQINANAQLTRLTASPFTVTAIVSDTADPPPLRITDAELYQLAERGPAVTQSIATLKAAQIGEATAKAIYWPQISLSTSLSQNNKDKHYDFGAGPMNYSWGLSIGASYTLWNAYGRESGIIRAKVTSDNADANLRNQKLTDRQNLTQFLGTLHTAEETIKLARLSIAASVENLRIVQQRYDRGSGLLQDLLTAQNSLNTARASLTTARVNARNARAQIEAIIGRDLSQ